MTQEKLTPDALKQLVTAELTVIEYNMNGIAAKVNNLGKLLGFAVEAWEQAENKAQSLQLQIDESAAAQKSGGDSED